MSTYPVKQDQLVYADETWCKLSYLDLLPSFSTRLRVHSFTQSFFGCVLDQMSVGWAILQFLGFASGEFEWSVRCTGPRDGLPDPVWSHTGSAKQGKQATIYFSKWQCIVCITNSKQGHLRTWVRSGMWKQLDWVVWEHCTIPTFLKGIAATGSYQNRQQYTGDVRLTSLDWVARVLAQRLRVTNALCDKKFNCYEWKCTDSTYIYDLA